MHTVELRILGMFWASHQEAINALLDDFLRNLERRLGGLRVPDSEILRYGVLHPRSGAMQFGTVGGETRNLRFR